MGSQYSDRQASDVKRSHKSFGPRKAAAGVARWRTDPKRDAENVFPEPGGNLERPFGSKCVILKVLRGDPIRVLGQVVKPSSRILVGSMRSKACPLQVEGGRRWRRLESGTQKSRHVLHTRGRANQYGHHGMCKKTRPSGSCPWARSIQARNSCPNAVLSNSRARTMHEA